MPCRGYTRRFVHPYLTAVHPQKSTKDEIGGMTKFWDDGKQEKTNKFPAKENKLTDKSCGSTAICKILRSSIDPFHTIVEISESQFCISIPVGKNFKPENLDVMVKDRVVIVEMKIEKVSEDGTSQLSQVFTKKIALLDEVKVEEIKSRLTPEGVLKIEATLITYS